MDKFTQTDSEDLNLRLPLFPGVRLGDAFLHVVLVHPHVLAEVVVPTEVLAAPWVEALMSC